MGYAQERRTLMEKTKNFLDPESMITPGVAGGVTMTISNALWVQFSVQPRYTGLALSFIISLLVILTWKAHSSLWLKGIYWIVNSLIIFSVALGGNYIGTASTKTTQPSQEASLSLINPAIKELKVRKQNLEQEIVNSKRDIETATANVKKAEENAIEKKKTSNKNKIPAGIAIVKEKAKLSPAKITNEKLEIARKELAQALEKKKIAEAGKNKTEQALLELENTLKRQNKPIQEGNSFFRAW